ncbi:rRNA adenine N-6-methyltransferase [Alloiococcus otitis]|uniref:rRNA adenine N-6-methyltransferase n=1 Tax=Alloiococcus otitis ATCC 51267 TaxID=883081 RepID=K9EAR3_9LACT|nr:23S ribosomal RNA methyltransferase Erm [Alloiococcus otitis]EKU92901.1 hypothetical protein HMPREF9698_01504 [Alloiococcus otitis ATCC 51267]SUU80412.1 rRNA adenine N-6-methyltransferase [Alloiococcus otitis]
MTKRKRKNKYHSKKFRNGNSPNFSGQHMLHNKKMIKDIVNLAHISKSDLVLELGAGKGALTKVLSNQAGRVLAVENDKKYISELQQLELQNTKIIQQDILKISLPRKPYIVVSNIPFAITTPIMKMLLFKPSSPLQSGLIIIEKGAAKRFKSNFVKDSYVVAWKMWFDIQYVKTIAKNNFSPKPRVDAALIKITRKTKPIVAYKDYLIFWGLADYLMKKPKLPIDLALEGIFTKAQIRHLKKGLQLKKELTVGNLSEKQWGFIFETMKQHVPKFRWPRIKKSKLKRL